MNLPIDFRMLCYTVKAETEKKGKVQEAKGNNEQHFSTFLPWTNGGNIQDTITKFTITFLKPQ